MVVYEAVKASKVPKVHAAPMDQLLRPVHRWVWSNPSRRAQKLLQFAETEADGCRDLVRAAELTGDALLRRLYLHHASDEHRHANLFRARGLDILRSLPRSTVAGFQANWLAPGERGLDDLRVDEEREDSLLAFLHLSEKAAAGRFALYREVLPDDAATRAVFDEILKDEAFHMNYTRTQLVRVSPDRHGRRLWWARLSRLWKGYLRIATAVAGVMGSVMLTLQYFVFLPPFAFLAKRAGRREPVGFRAIDPKRNLPTQSQY